MVCHFYSDYQVNNQNLNAFIDEITDLHFTTLIL